MHVWHHVCIENVPEANRMRIRLSIFAVITSLSLIAIFSASGAAQNQTVRAEAERISNDRFSIATRTPRGAYVYAVSTPNSETLTAIDSGLTVLFAVARKNGYRKKLKYRDYSIYIGKADRVKDSANGYSPDIAVAAAQYAGTEYDKGGYIYAAGIVVALNPCAFLIAEHTKDFGRIADVVRYEGEHLVLFANDRQRYASTADHSKGGGHPILQ